MSLERLQEITGGGGIDVVMPKQGKKPSLPQYACTDLSISSLCEMLVMSAMYFITFFDASVFPAPLSPKTQKTSL